MNRAGELGNDEKNPQHNLRDIRSALFTIFRATMPWKAKSSPFEEMPAATWVHFFQRVGLDKIEDLDDQGMRRVIADYLPSDLLAATC